LAVQSANDSNSASDRQSLQAEVDQLVSEINRIAETTTFNGSKVANGSLKNLNFQSGANAGETVGVKGVDARASALGSQPGPVQSTYDRTGNTAVANQSALTITVGNNGEAVNIMSAENGGNITGATALNLRNTASADFGSGFAKSLAERINKLREDGVEGMEGVYASAKTTFTSTDANASAGNASIGAGSLANGDLTINGIDIGPVEIQEKD